MSRMMERGADAGRTRGRGEMGVGGVCGVVLAGVDCKLRRGSSWSDWMSINHLD